MSEAGVIPPPEERQPYVREVGRITDPNGIEVRIGVDYDSVTVKLGHSMQLARLDEGLVEDLAQALVAACWEAGRNARHMAGEVPY